MKVLRVAIVHDWLVGGGAEKVVLELHKMFPDAPIYTSYCTDEWREKLDDQVITGWLQHFGKLRKFLVLGRIWWFSHLDLSDYDLVISSCGNGEAFGIHTEKPTTHVCYCHSPTHYYWRHYDQYMSNPGFGAFDWLARIGLRLLVGPLRKWDLKAAQRPDYFIANSTHIQEDIKKYYGRDSVVIFPPIDLEQFKYPRASERHGFVIIGRQTTYKKYDIAVEACNKLGSELVVSGDGPDHKKLTRLAGDTVKFGYVSDADKASFLAGAEGFIFTPFEDFGITPIEALACGTPVIAFKAGGALDYIKPGENGEFFEAQTVDSLTKALKEFNPTSYSEAKIRASARQFSSEQFHNNFSRFLADIK